MCGSLAGQTRNPLDHLWLHHKDKIMNDIAQKVDALGNDVSDLQLRIEALAADIRNNTMSFDFVPTMNDQVPGVEDSDKIQKATCSTCGAYEDGGLDNDDCEWTDYQPYQNLDIKVTEYPYWDGECIRYVYWMLRFRAGKLTRALKYVEGECQDGCVVCATDCVTLVDPECADL